MTIPRLSIAIPSRNEKFLNQTILDVLKNTGDEVMIYPVLDGYTVEEPEPIIDSRVRYLRIPHGDGKNHKRQGINMMVDQCNTEFVMSLDAHCMVAPNFALQLIEDHFQNNLVQVPRRNRLDAENWCIQEQVDDRPPIDFEYIQFHPLVSEHKIHGFRWDDRTHKHMEELIVDTITFQGSCWFMTKDWFKERGFMDLKYQGWGQEAECISFETWLNGGRVVSNKNTWYAHLHKGRLYGRMYTLHKSLNEASYAYSFNLWLRERNDFFISLCEKFEPMPNWPKNWKDQLRKLK